MIDDEQLLIASQALMHGLWPELRAKGFSPSEAWFALALAARRFERGVLYAYRDRPELYERAKADLAQLLAVCDEQCDETDERSRRAR
jgi:hypothetical protein